MVDRIRVPATTANIGPGFDCLGAAVSVGLELSWTDGDGWSYVYEGQGPPHEAPDASLVLSAASRVLGEVPEVALEMRSAIPLGCGLGSSSAAIAAGLLLGCALAGKDLGPAELLDLGAPLEGHPDNLAPAIYGGVVVVTGSGGSWEVMRFDPASSVRPSILVPLQQLSTEEARRALPDQIDRSDAVFNIGRAAGLAVVLSGAVEASMSNLMAFTDDAVHQSYRAPLMPQTADAIDHLRSAGVPAAVSGAGPSVVCLVVDGHQDVLDAAVDGLDGWVRMDVEWSAEGAHRAKD